MKTIVIYHRADFDGLFCREIARKFLPEAELVGWDYGDEDPPVDKRDVVYMLDISVAGLMDHPNLIWIDHHKSAMEKYADTIPGYRIDGVAACRLAWQWFANTLGPGEASYIQSLTKLHFVERMVSEPLAVRLAGEYDIWDKRDPRAELFQHGLRSQELTSGDWALLLESYLGSAGANGFVERLLNSGKAIQYATTQQNESIIKAAGFTIQFEGLTFLACNHARYNRHLFSAGLRPEHDGCFGFCWDGQQWKVSLYGVPGKPEVDLSRIAVKYGGGGHKQACGFRCEKLPFLPLDTLTLTVDQIKDLAGVAGLRVEGEITDEDKETEITITPCPKQGIKDDDGSIVRYRHIAYWEEYPEEGVCPLGQKLVSE